MNLTKFWDDKVNVRKFNALLYTISDQLKNWIKNIIYNIRKNIKYQEINLMKDPPTLKTTKTYLREINEGGNKIKDTAYPWVKRLEPQIKILRGFVCFLRIDYLVLNFIWKCKELKYPKQYWKKEQSGKTYTTSLKTYHKLQ